MWQTGAAITEGNVTKVVSDLTLSALAFHLQNTPFIDAPLSIAPSRFPSSFSPATCVRCLAADPKPILADCNISTSHPTYPPGSLFLTFQTKTTAFGTVALSFNATANYSKPNNASDPLAQFSGPGDFAFSGKVCASFVLRIPDKLCQD